MKKRSSSQPLRGAMIGFGFISSQGHLPAYLKRAESEGDVRITAIADISEERRALASRLLPQARIYSDAFELLKYEQWNLDFVDITTPPRDHASIAHAALELGLHVLCEKPLTITLKEAESLLRHAKAVKRVLFPVHNYKFAPVIKKIRSLIEAGAIGRVRSVTLNTFRTTHAKGVQEWNEDWRRDSELSGGGIAMDHGSHSFYLTFDWLKEYPLAVTAKTTKLGADDFNTEDNFSAVLTFPSGFAHCHLSWTSGVRKVLYSIQGEKGAITVDDDELQLAIQQNDPQCDHAAGAMKWRVERHSIASDWMDASHVGWFNSLFDEFVDAIDREIHVGRDALEAYRCIEVIAQAYVSAGLNSQEVPLNGIQNFN